MTANDEAHYRGVDRARRREAKRRRQKKMVVTGRGVFTINRLLGERARQVKSEETKGESHSE